MEYQWFGAYLIVHIGEELDHHHAEELKKAMDNAFEEKGYRNIIFDFSNTRFMDSSGVGMIISRYRDLTMCGFSVCVAGVSDILTKQFFVSGLHKIIRIYPKVEDVFDEK